MRLQISNESVQFMRDLAKKIPNSLEELEKDNNEIMRCYYDVQKTIGPHTQEICAIVECINQRILQTSDYVQHTARVLNSVADRFDRILHSPPDPTMPFSVSRQQFINSIKVAGDHTSSGPRTATQSNLSSSNNDATSIEEKQQSIYYTQNTAHDDR